MRRVVASIALACGVVGCSLLADTSDLSSTALPAPETPVEGPDSGRGPSGDASVDASAPLEAGGPDGDGATGASYPATGILDDFDRADGPLGGVWAVDDARMRIEGEALRYFPPSTGDGCGPTQAAWGAAFGARQEVHVRITNHPGYGTISLYAKRNGSLYVSLEYDTQNKSAHVQTYEGGASVVKGPTFPLSVGPEDRLGLRHHEDGRAVVFKNGAPIFEHVTTGWSGNAGGGAIAVGGACADNGAGLSFDDFGGGDVP